MIRTLISDWLHFQVNLRHGVHGPETRTGTETETCTACAGTIILEFAALSRFTGDPTFEVKYHYCFSFVLFLMLLEHQKHPIIYIYSQYI